MKTNNNIPAMLHRGRITQFKTQLYCAYMKTAF